MSFLSSLFSSAKLPPPPSPPPAREDDAVQEAAARQRRAQMLSRGRASTVLTGDAGVTGVAPVTQKKLLGE